MSKFISVRISEDDMLGLLEDARDLISLAECLVARAEVLGTSVCEFMGMDDSNIHARSETAMSALHEFSNLLHGTADRVIRKFEEEDDA